MSWVGLLNGKVVSMFWFVDDGGDNVSVNQTLYLKMLQDDVVPKVQAKFGDDLRRFWFQQVCCTPSFKVIRFCIEGLILGIPIPTLKVLYLRLI